MAAIGTVTIGGSITGLPSGNQTITGSIVSSAAIGEVLPVAISSGANTINVPAGANAVLITPPSANAATLTLKGITGDTGVIIAPSPNSLSNPCLLPLNVGQTTLVLTASAPVSGVVTFLFI